MKRILKNMATTLGYEVRYPVRKRPPAPTETEGSNWGFDLEQEALEAIEQVKDHTMLSLPRLVTLYQQAAFCEEFEIGGSFVECGTWRGGSVGIMALANLRRGRARRHIHLFDSFESIPEPDEAVDGERAVREARECGGGAEGRLVPLPIYGSIGTPDLAVNRELLEETIGYNSSFLHYHKGWFQDTVPSDAKQVGDIAILRLDGDWYASTKVCLDHLYDQVVSGGFVIIDDYGCYEGCKKATDEFMRQQQVRAFLHHIDATGRYWVKP